MFLWGNSIIRGRYYPQYSRKNVDNWRELWESQMLNINDRGVLQWDFNFAKTVVPLALVIIWNRKTKLVVVIWESQQIAVGFDVITGETRGKCTNVLDRGGTKQ